MSQQTSIEHDGPIVRALSAAAYDIWLEQATGKTPKAVRLYVDTDIVMPGISPNLFLQRGPRARIQDVLATVLWTLGKVSPTVCMFTPHYHELLVHVSGETTPFGQAEAVKLIDLLRSGASEMSLNLINLVVSALGLGDPKGRRAKLVGPDRINWTDETDPRSLYILEGREQIDQDLTRRGGRDRPFEATYNDALALVALEQRCAKTDEVVRFITTSTDVVASALACRKYLPLSTGDASDDLMDERTSAFRSSWYLVVRTLLTNAIRDKQLDSEVSRERLAKIASAPGAAREWVDELLGGVVSERGTLDLSSRDKVVSRAKAWNLLSGEVPVATPADLQQWDQRVSKLSELVASDQPVWHSAAKALRARIGTTVYAPTVNRYALAAVLDAGERHTVRDAAANLLKRASDSGLDGAAFATHVIEQLRENEALARRQFLVASGCVSGLLSVRWLLEDTQRQGDPDASWRMICLHLQLAASLNSAAWIQSLGHAQDIRAGRLSTDHAVYLSCGYGLVHQYIHMHAWQGQSGGPSISDKRETLSAASFLLDAMEQGSAHLTKELRLIREMKTLLHAASGGLQDERRDSSARVLSDGVQLKDCSDEFAVAFAKLKLNLVGRINTHLAKQGLDEHDRGVLYVQASKEYFEACEVLKDADSNNAMALRARLGMTGTDLERMEPRPR